MGVVVVVYAAFGLAVSETKPEIMCLRAKGMLESTATFSVEAAGQVYNQKNEFVYLGGNVNRNADLSIKVDRRIRNAWCSFRRYTLELYDRSSATPLELKTRMLRFEVLETMLYDCVTWSPRACHNDTLRRAHHSFLTRCIGWRKHNRADHPISYLDTRNKTGKVTGDFTQKADLVCGICGAHGGYETAEGRDVWRNGGGRGLCGGPRRRVDGAFPGRSQSFRQQRQPVDDCSPGRGGMAQSGRKRGGTFRGKMDRYRKKQGWTAAYSGMLERDGRTKERMAQSKRARAGLLALVD